MYEKMIVKLNEWYDDFVVPKKKENQKKLKSITAEPNGCNE